jgi:hypothetical protein
MRLIIDYFAYVVRSGASARRAACRRPRAVSPLNFSSVGRTGSRRASGHCVSRRSYSLSGLYRLSHMPCIRTCRLTTRLLVNRSHWLSPCVWSLCLAAQLLVVRIAPALLRLCRASGHAVSPLDFLSVGRTGSRRASDHCLSWRDYSSSGLHRLYCTYVVHPYVPSHRSTSRQSVTLALAMRPVTAYRGATTRCLDCTGSTAPMLCIRTRHLDARLLVSRSHWISPCAWSFRCAS